MSYKCQNCDAELRYIENDNIWVCDYCRSKFNNIESNDFKIYTCEKCKLEFISNQDISRCIHCNNKLSSKELKNNFNIESYLPYKIDKETAIKKYRNLCNSNIFNIVKFRNNKTIKKIIGVYIPVIISNYNGNGEINSEVKSISKWKSGNYNYKKTDLYNVFRGGTMCLENIPISCNNKIKDDIIEELHPYNYKESKKFNFTSSTDFIFYKPNIEIENIKKDSISKAQNIFVDILKSDITGYTDIKIKDKKINLNNTDMKLVLLPTWLIKFKYKKNIYKFYINGQTGEISGSIPKSKFRIISIWLTLFIIFSFIMFLLEYLKVIK